VYKITRMCLDRTLVWTVTNPVILIRSPGSCASIGLAEDVDLKLRQGIRVVICLDTGNYGVELVEESVLHSSVLESTRSKICY